MEVDASILTRDDDKLRRFKNMRNVHFDSFSDDTNQDKVNIAEEDRVQFDREKDGEVRETETQSSKTEKNCVAGGKSCQRAGGNDNRSECVKEGSPSESTPNYSLKDFSKEDRNESQGIRVSVGKEKYEQISKGQAADLLYQPSEVSGSKRKDGLVGLKRPFDRLKGYPLSSRPKGDWTRR